MSEALFYHLERKSLDDVLPGLLERTRERGWRAVVQVGSAERMAALDTHLWTYSEQSFLAHGTAADGQEVSEMPVDRVMSGIVFLDELRTSIGTLLVPKVFEVTDAFLERMRNFGPGILQEKVRVLSPVKRAALRTTA